jgi:hypothetical protein
MLRRPSSAIPELCAVSIGWHEDTEDARNEIAQAIARVERGPECSSRRTCLAEHRRISR